VESIATYPCDQTSASVVMSVVDNDRSSEAALIDRAAGGDVDAFEELYRANSGRVYVLCLRMTGEPALAEELAQEALVRAWQKLSSFRGASAFSTWLHRVTVNVVLGHRRNTARRESRVQAVGDDFPGDATVRQAWPAESIDLERAVASLPDGARTVFVLHDVEGYRHREISDITGIAIGTSKAQLHRARKMLRKALMS